MASVVAVGAPPTQTATAATTNLATGKQATQSSDWSSQGVATKAIDGNLSGIWASGSVTSTQLEQQPWWQVDLGQPHSIDTIRISNRTDCCAGRLDGAVLLVSHLPFAAGATVADHRARPDVTGYVLTSAQQQTVDVGGSARYVRVQVPRYNAVNLAEVEVFGQALPNVARGKVATQSSDWSADGVAGKAVDGNRSGIWASGSVAATRQQAQPWWQVDLGQSHDVEAVVVYNRTDCCVARLGGGSLLLSDRPFPAGATVAELRARADVTAFDLTAGQVQTLAVGGSARYVRIQLPRTDIINIAEVEVFGVPAAASASEEIAQGRPATQSSSYDGWTIAEAAVDGNRSGLLSARGLSITRQEAQPWWQVDLERASRIDSVEVFNRTDCCGARLDGAYLLVSSEPFGAGSPAEIATRPGVFSARLDGSATQRVPVGQLGRYVRVQLPGTGHLQLAEVVVMGSPPPASAVGRWGSVIDLPLVPSSVAVLPDNRVLLWSAVGTMNYGGATGQTQTVILDLDTGQLSSRTVVNTNHQMFCTGISTLPDGRVVITGGSNDNKTTIYDPRDDSWTTGPSLQRGRGYQSDVVLSDGRIFTIGGSWAADRVTDKGAEIFDLQSGWRILSGIAAAEIETQDQEGRYRSDNHAWLFADEGGSVFQAGPSTGMHWISTAGNGSVSDAGRRGDDADAMNGNAVMFDLGKILTVGGAPDYSRSFGTTNAFTIDIGSGPGRAPMVARTGSTATARAFASSVVLPDGTVFTAGGQRWTQGFTDTAAAMSPERWDPATGAWTTMSPMAVPRTYHSVGVLLPDATVLMGGGGLCGSCTTNHPDIEIFTPPYLLEDDGTQRVRPRITQVPATVEIGGDLVVSTDRPVASFALVRLSTATHTVNTDQRRISLVAGPRTGSSYSLAVPSSTGDAIPGNYFLFALDERGTPSVAATVRIGAGESG